MQPIAICKMDGITTLMASDAVLATVIILLTIQVASLGGQEDGAIDITNKKGSRDAVSYTHLTLPTILLV